MDRRFVSPFPPLSRAPLRRAGGRRQRPSGRGCAASRRLCRRGRLRARPAAAMWGPAVSRPRPRVRLTRGTHGAGRRPRLHRPVGLRRRRLVFLPARLAYYAAAVGRLRLHRRPASVAADCCPRLYGWLVTPPFTGVHVFTDRLAFVAADWYCCLHGWPIMSPLLGVYDFIAGLPLSPPTGVLAYTVGRPHHRSWASTSSPTGLPSPPLTGVSAYTAGQLCRRWIQIQICIKGIHGFQLISYAPGMDQSEHHHQLAIVAADCCLRLYSWLLAYYAAVVGRLHLHRPAASSAADWCFRLHGWPIMPPLLGVYIFTDRPPHPPSIGVTACMCFGLHGWPIMPPLLGVYVFTDRPPHPPSTGVTACTAGLLCRRCWASTYSPTGRLVRRRLVFLPARLAYYATVVGRLRLYRPAAFVCRRLVSPPSRLVGHTTVVGRLRLHRPACLRHHRLVFSPARPAYYAAVVGRHRLHRLAASSAADWSFCLHGRPIMPLLLGVIDFTDCPPRPPPIGVSACTAGLLCRRCCVSRPEIH
uniref:cysteine dioxygenase n=1 Tax=Oryza sativa subsp. japonica TaxID=39947 RepID=Q6K3L5_ORYSJ|nr:HGWP repeat containing protein-like [Oryza sativa Japonica Group]